MSSKREQNMNSRYDATKRSFLFSWWNILLFAFLFLGFLMILYPKKLLLSSLKSNQQPSQISISYLQNLIQQDPSNISLKSSLALQEFNIGQVKEAKSLIAPIVTMTPKSELEWNILSLYYRIIRVEAFKLKINSPNRQKKEAELNSLIAILINSPYLNAEDGKLLAQDALAFNKPQLALAFYNAVVKSNIIQSPSFYALAGQAALFVNDYGDSAKFYLLAMQHSTTLADKRSYFAKAIDSLRFSGNSRQALEFAQKNIDGLAKDKATLVKLTKLAMEANNPQGAVHYVDTLLQLRYTE